MTSNSKYHLLLSAIFFLVFLLLTPLGIFNDWIPPLTQTGYYSIAAIDPGDDTGYYAYLRSAFFDGDWDFINEGNYAHIEHFTPTGYVFNNWQIGQSILFLPFFLVGHLVALIYNSLGYAVSVDGYSAPYYMATAVASQTYLFAGLLLLFNILKKRFGNPIALISTLAIWLGSPLIYYTFIRQRMAHTAEFFLAVVFIYFWLKERNSEDYFKHTILGGVLGLLCTVRLLDIGFLALYLADQIFLLKSKQDVSLPLKARALLVRTASFGGFFILMLLPQLLAWNQLNGIPLPSRHVQFAGQGLAGFSLLPFLEKAYSLFFSVQWGLALSAPLMVLGLIGVFAGSGVAKELRAGFGAYLFFLFLMIILYPEGSDSYSHRHLISALPILAWGLAGIFRWCSGNRLLSTAAILLALMCVEAQYFMLIQYKVTLLYNDPEFTVKALGAIPSLIMNQPHLLLRSSNFIRLIFLDHPQAWNYNDFLFLIVFPVSQLVCVILVFAGFERVARLPKTDLEFRSKLVAGGVALTTLSLVVLIGFLTPSKTRQEINNRKISAALMKRGDALAKSKEVDQAIDVFSQASSLVPKHWTPFFRKGLAYDVNKNYFEANKNYRRVLSAYPGHFPSLINMGRNLNLLDRSDEAETILRLAIRINPLRKRTHNYLAQAYGNQRKFAKAKTAFETALILDSEYGNAHINLALLLTMMDEEEEAIFHLKEAMRLGAEGPGTLELSKRYKLSKIE